MISFSISADKRCERRFHLIIPMSMGAIALALAPSFSNNLVLSVICLALAAAGLLSATPMFWSLPPAFLGGVWAAAGIGAINAIGNVAGFASPYVMGGHRPAELGPLHHHCDRSLRHAARLPPAQERQSLIPSVPE